jgi:hypothetical protein
MQSLFQASFAVCGKNLFFTQIITQHQCRVLSLIFMCGGQKDNISSTLLSYYFHAKDKKIPLDLSAVRVGPLLVLSNTGLSVIAPLRLWQRPILPLNYRQLVRH